MQKFLVIFVCAFLMLSFDYIASYPLFDQPPHFPKPIYNFNKNPLDSAAIELGRALFYDPILSKDNSISCASCHSPFNAFAHTDHDLSHGIFDSIGTRNAPALFNLAWQKSFMWDGAINHLDVQALAPITSQKEMGSSIKEVIAKLNASKEYKSQFNQVFKDPKITSSRILKALSQFQLTLISAGSKYDLVVSGKDQFTHQEKNGYELFLKNCNSCHQEPLFSNYTIQDNGLPLDSTLNDLGRFNISQVESDKMKFKVPSLRNLSYTYPYMHDGRFRSLKEVINHYTERLYKTPNKSPIQDNPIKLNSNEKVDLIAFLLTLNDPNFVFDKKHQFKKISMGAKE